MSIHHKSEIIEALQNRVAEVCVYMRSLDRQHFEFTPPGKWSAGQNLDHLIRSMRPLLLAYSLPGFVLRLMFGRSNRPSKTYEQLVAKYKLRLAAGGLASGRFVPQFISYSSLDEGARKYELLGNMLSKKIRRSSEEKLDKYILPHPLLGKLTMREMLFFTIHHNEHHLEILKVRETHAG